MSLIKRMLKYQTAVYWAPDSVDPDGSKTYQPPIQVQCRWEDGGFLYRNNQGEESVSSARVFVDSDMVEGGVLWLGKLADVEDQDDPMQNKEPGMAREIVQFRKTPDRKAKEYVRIAMLGGGPK